MILDRQEAHKVLPLITDLEAYDAFKALLEALHKRYYNDLVHENSCTARGALILIDELKTLRERLKDSLDGTR